MPGKVARVRRRKVPVVVATPHAERPKGTTPINWGRVGTDVDPVVQEKTTHAEFITVGLGVNIAMGLVVPPKLTNSTKRATYVNTRDGTPVFLGWFTDYVTAHRAVVKAYPAKRQLIG